MRIAILGWGSLIWDPRDLPREGVWQVGGPVLPIEFSRVSRDCRLTAVVDFEHGMEVPTRYVLSPRVDIDDAIADLRIREDTVKRHIAFLNLQSNSDSAASNAHHRRACEVVRTWLGPMDFLGVVWTALPSNFRSETGEDFSVDAAIEYLNGLPCSAKQNALRYIRNAPVEVDTPLRRKLDELRLL